MSAQPDAVLNSTPIRVGVETADTVVRHGIRALMAEHSDRVTVVDHELTPHSVDVLLVVVTPSNSAAAPDRVRHLVAAGFMSVVTLGWCASPLERGRLRKAGAREYAAMDLPAEELLDLFERLGQSPRDSVTCLADSASPSEVLSGRHGLTEREAQVLLCVAEGLSNNEIASELFIGINTVKTYIRTAYRKIGVERRSQAVIWALEQGA